MRRVFACARTAIAVSLLLGPVACGGGSDDELGTMDQRAVAAPPMGSAGTMSPTAVAGSTSSPGIAGMTAVPPSTMTMAGSSAPTIGGSMAVPPMTMGG